MNCDCVERINRELRDTGHDYQLAPSLIFDKKMRMESLLSINTRWIDEPPRGRKHKPPPAMICTYCPFCRKKTKGNK